MSWISYNFTRDSDLTRLKNEIEIQDHKPVRRKRRWKEPRENATDQRTRDSGPTPGQSVRT